MSSPNLQGSVALCFRNASFVIIRVRPIDQERVALKIQFVIHSSQEEEAVRASQGHKGKHQGQTGSRGNERKR